MRPAAELAVAGLSVATVLTSWRLFTDGRGFPVLVCAALLSHLVGALTRRAGWGALASLGMSLVGAGHLRLHRPVPRHQRSSACPRGPHGRPRSSSSAPRGTSSRPRSRPSSRPAGFITAVILLVWLLAYAADDFAHRAEAPIEAVVPSGVLFLVGTALGRRPPPAAATALWLAAAALTVAILRVERSEGAGWFGGTRRRAVSTTVRVGAGVAAAAVIVGAIAGPALPGASSDPLARHPPGSLVADDAQPARRHPVPAGQPERPGAVLRRRSRPAYWRLTALDEYDLRIWRSSRSYGDASGTLVAGIREDLGVPLDHTIQITGLDSVWLPAAFAPRPISIPDQVRYDAESGQPADPAQHPARRAHLPADLGRARRRLPPRSRPAAGGASCHP